MGGGLLPATLPKQRGGMACMCHETRPHLTPMPWAAPVCMACAWTTDADQKVCSSAACVVCYAPTRKMSRARTCLPASVHGVHTTWYCGERLLPCARTGRHCGAHACSQTQMATTRTNALGCMHRRPAIVNTNPTQARAKARGCGQRLRQRTKKTNQCTARTPNEGVEGVERGSVQTLPGLEQ